MRSWIPSVIAGQAPAQLVAGQEWDVIVIGTGIGGGIAGRRLAESGLSVLFIEKGPLGYRTESQDLRLDVEDYNARQMRGFWPTRVEAQIDGGRPQRFFAPIGSGVGGTSVFYAAAAERPERHDLETVGAMAHPTGGWPVGYDAFVPYFDQAARLLSVRGGADPASGLPAPPFEPPPLSAAETALFQDLRALGLHPYRAHEALRRLPGCAGCLGRKCPLPCKMDGRSAGIEPAMETGRATLMANASVEELIESGGRITQVRVRRAGHDLLLTAPVVVLAAGALHSPRILLGSTGTHPEGCANSSGWVGRGLMFHLSEMVALWPRRGQPAFGATRALAFRDLYAHGGMRLGLVQSMGLSADAGHIAAHLKDRIAKSRLARLPGVGRLATLLARIGGLVFGKATVLVGVLEDLPYFDNLVQRHPEDPDVPLIRYRLHDELLERRAVFRRAIRRVLGRGRTLLLGFSPALNFGHPCGTLRFGSDPRTSVLDANCKAHDLDNLYVADASFLPTSMGVNPSLTIAANALRVADVIASRLQAERRKAV
ncbi:GMC family oxidoreductase [Rhodobacter sp. M37P]|uniref:GMC family oxidoreductase n=2 Tax=Rhodobacter calidifons TaxID=2715277 RepID=A0ABX0GAM5_9RHOB|nr:GMC family oxidoreductase [Rhodobacter calidifons]NHB77938.1 GMC family oxidoreductase [Rhodobacter calidifons]